MTTIHNRVIRWLYYYISCKSFVINRGCLQVRDLYQGHWSFISDQETGDCSSSVNTIFESILLDTLYFTQNNFTGRMKQHLLSGNVVYILCYRCVHCVGMTDCYWSEQTYTIVNSRDQMSIQKHLRRISRNGEVVTRSLWSIQLLQCDELGVEIAEALVISTKYLSVISKCKLARWRQ